MNDLAARPAKGDASTFMATLGIPRFISFISKTIEAAARIREISTENDNYQKCCYTFNFISAIIVSRPQYFYLHILLTSDSRDDRRLPELPTERASCGTFENKHGR